MERSVHVYDKETLWHKSTIITPEWINPEGLVSLISAVRDMRDGKVSEVIQHFISLLETERARLIEVTRAEALQKALSVKGGSLPYDWRDKMRDIILESVPTEIPGSSRDPRDESEDIIDWALLPRLMEKFFSQDGISEDTYDGPVRTITDNSQA